MMTDADLAKLEALARKATPGPFTAEEHEKPGCFGLPWELAGPPINDDRGKTSWPVPVRADTESNARFYAEARAGVLNLIATVRQERLRADMLHEALNQTKETAVDATAKLRVENLELQAERDRWQYEALHGRVTLLLAVEDESPRCDDVRDEMEVVWRRGHLEMDEIPPEWVAKLGCHVQDMREILERRRVTLEGQDDLGVVPRTELTEINAAIGPTDQRMILSPLPAWLGKLVYEWGEARVREELDKLCKQTPK